MRRLLDPVVKTASELAEATKKVVDDGVEFFRGSLGKTPLFSSIIAGTPSEERGRDETHYYLVPYRLSETGYALYTRRMLPDGIGPVNDLPKARIFHLPSDGALEQLEELILTKLTKEQRQNISHHSRLADRLDTMAEEIDKQSNLVTGGLVLVGGVVALANPLLGIGLAAKAMLPTLGTKLSKHGMQHASDWLRDKKSKDADKKAAIQAGRETSRIPPEIEICATLALLEEALLSKDTSFDPSFRFAGLMNTPAEARDVTHACSAIHCVYNDILRQKKIPTEALLHKADLDWLKSVREIGSA